MLGKGSVIDVDFAVNGGGASTYIMMKTGKLYVLSTIIGP